MRILYEILPTLAENVALDEVLLESCSGGNPPGQPVLRLWRNPRVAVAIGKSEKLGEVVHTDALSGIEVVRRFTGGGSVVVGPASLCVTLITPHHAWRPRDIYHAFTRFQNTVAVALRRLGVDSYLEPPSDLVVGGRKISGCAQSRKRQCTAVHSTILLDHDPAPMETLLRIPPKIPAYRAGRAHGEFVTALRVIRPDLSLDRLHRALVDGFCADFDASPDWTPLPAHILKKARNRAATRYATDDWTRRR